MIPHTPGASLRTQKARLLPPPRRRDGSAELSCHESGDRSTGFFGFSRGFCLREDSNQGLGSRRADEHAALAVELCVEALDLAFDAFRKLTLRDPDVGLRLWKARHRGGGLLQRAAP